MITEYHMGNLDTFGLGSVTADGLNPIKDVTKILKTESEISKIASAGDYGFLSKYTLDQLNRQEITRVFNFVVREVKSGNMSIITRVIVYEHEHFAKAKSMAEYMKDPRKTKYYYHHIKPAALARTVLEIFKNMKK
jgi:hypothetical protein